MASIYYKNGSSFINIGTALYPVGSVYISYSSTSPASIYGGSWSAITGRFPYFNAGTSTGGNNTHSHTLTSAYGQFRYDVQNNPNLQIGLKSASWTNSTGLLYEWTWSQIGRAITGKLNAGIIAKGMALGGSVDSNSHMPSYQTLYAWRRTS